MHRLIPALIILCIIIAAACGASDIETTPDPDSTPPLLPTPTEDNSAELNLQYAQTTAAALSAEIDEKTKTAEATRTAVALRLQPALTPVNPAPSEAPPPTTGAPHPIPIPIPGLRPLPVNVTPQPTNDAPTPETDPDPSDPTPTPTKTNAHPVPPPSNPSPTETMPPARRPTSTPRPTRVRPTATTPAQPLSPVPHPYPPYVTSTPGPAPTRVPRPAPTDPPEPQPVTFIDDKADAAALDRETIAALKAIPWTADGIDHQEAPSLELLIQLAAVHPEPTRELMAMPFLESVNPGDLETLQALHYLAQNQPAIYAGLAKAQRAYQVGPITDRNRGAAIAWGTQAKLNRASNGPPAQPITYDTTPPVTRNINGRAIQFTVTRQGPHLKRTTDNLAAAVEKAEKLMNRPLPVNAVMAVILPMPIDYYNAAFGIIINSKFAANIPDGIKAQELDILLREREAIFLKAIMQYYWHGNIPWIDYGIAQTAATYDKSGSDRFNYPCPYAATINQLEARPHRDDIKANVQCAEATGSRFFLELQSIIGDNALWNAITKLYDLGNDIESPLNRGYVISQLQFYSDIAQQIIIAGPRSNPAAYAHATSSAIISANARITETWLAAAAGCHRKIPQPIKPSQSAGARLMCFRYAYNPAFPQHAADLTMTEYGPDGLPYHRTTFPIETRPGEDESVGSIRIGPGGGGWAPGVHRITLANEDGSLALNYGFAVIR